MGEPKRAVPAAVDAAAVMDVLRTIPDPEMPISIVDLGIVHAVTVEADGIVVEVLPTFIGCPALPMIESDIRARVGALPGAPRVTVRFRHDPPWTVDRISERGRARLRDHGVSTPAPRDQRAAGVELRTSAVACPFCGARQTHLESAFGPTRCRMIYHCDACRNSFERLKRLEPAHEEGGAGAGGESPR
jgi:ring-1,2-phenylacetyl-CoA epoxidase subunit PaaD